MPEPLVLKLWSPSGEWAEFELAHRSQILPRLTRWAQRIGCRVADVDFQINEGIRVLGEASAQARHIDVCGLPRQP